MILTQEDMIKRILDTKAVSIWNHKTGPIFWYAASVPGPFYVNTELVLGGALSARLLEDITAIVADVKTAEARAERLEALMMKAYEADAFYQSVIETLEARARQDFASGSYSVISGGERRDWLFSIPLARKMGIPHAYLFKNGELYCADPIGKDAAALHVSDLINNAASHFDAWFPILEKNGLRCAGTLCVISRGSNGLERLERVGQKVVALNGVDLSFFETCRDSRLVEQELVDELRLFFEDQKAWASAYVMEKPELFNAGRIDKKSFERLCHFIQHDPWELREKHADFFAEMEKAIAARQAA